MGKGRIALPSVRGRPASPVKESTWKLATTKMPASPDELSGEALIEWHRLETFLVALNRVSELDKQALAVYCLYWGRFANLMARHFTEEDALLYADGPTCEVVHPLLPDLLDYARGIMAIAGEFGLTARTRDLDGDNTSRIPSMLKTLYGNRKKVAESKIPTSVIPMLPDWDESDLDPPMWMNSRALVTYRELGKQLRNLDLFTPIDKIHICVMSCIGDLLYRANEQLREDYVTVYSKKPNDDGDCEPMYQKAHPLHKVVKELGKVLREYWTAYGMTPRARKIFGNESKVDKKERPLVFKGKFA